MNTRLVLIECGTTSERVAHVVFECRNKVITIFLSGVMTNLQALDEYRMRPFEFVRKYGGEILEVPEHFGLRK
jgi:hypothetical protein